MHRRPNLERFDRRAQLPETEPAADPVGAPMVAEVEEKGPAELPTREPGPSEDAPDALAQFLQNLEDLLADARQACRAAECAAAEAMGRAAATAVPHLARTAFPAEVAAASLALLRRGEFDRLELRIAPPDFEEIGSALAAVSPGLPIDAVADADLTSGAARMVWADGGVEFDCQRLADAAEACLRRSLDDQARCANPNEETAA